MRVHHNVNSSVFFLLLLFTATSNHVALATVHYVNSARPDDSGNGLSWATAERTLQAALQSVVSTDEIWVAAGTYYPDEGPTQALGDRTATFQLVNGVAIYGGFVGSETLLSQRGVTANETILSGDITQNDAPIACTLDSPDCDANGGLCDNGFCIISDNNVENSYHVTTGSGTDATAFLDEFTITGGNADPIPDSGGGGMIVLFGSPTLTNCSFIRNESALQGGGLFHFNDSLTLTNCTFRNNATGGQGGGISSNGGSLIISKCIFTANAANFGGPGRGGALEVSNSNTTISDSLFRGNSSFDRAGGMSIFGGNVAVVGCTFVANTSNLGGGIWSASGSPAITNCVFNTNQSLGSGGAMMYENPGAVPQITNCIFRGNTTNTNGGGVFTINGASPKITNCILWENIEDADGSSGGPFMTETAQIHDFSGASVVNYSIIQGGWTGAGGTGNSASDPLFVDADGADNIAGTVDDDLRISSSSPAIDAGDNDAIPVDTTDLDNDGDTAELIPIDLGGTERRIDDTSVVDTGNAGTVGAPVVDIGAFEFIPPLFVNDDATGANNGTSWTDAYTTLQDALADVGVTGGAISSIWVAAGTYYPDEGGATAANVRTETFQLVNGVAIYGGFVGGETLLSQRDVTANATILSGDITQNDTPVACTVDSPDCDANGGRCAAGFCIINSNNTENSFHVVTGSGTDTSAMLDGFTITAGNADGGLDDDDGGGMLTISGSPTVSYCWFRGNMADFAGGGMGNKASNTTVFYCTFSGNNAVENGGGMYNFNGSNSLITNCSFVGNIANNGGGILNQDSSPNVTGCMFNGNSVNSFGGGIHDSSSSSMLANCTFSSNSADRDGGGMYNFNGSSPNLTNCLLWGNLDDADGGSGGPFMDESAQIHTQSGTPVVNYSIVQGGWTGAGGIGNSASDPIFFDADGQDNIMGTEDDDLRIWIGSPAIDAGDNDALPTDSSDLDNDGNILEEIPLDLDGNDRRIEVSYVVDSGLAGAVGLPVVDMGAFEFDPLNSDMCQTGSETLSETSDRHHEFRIAEDFIPIASGISRIGWAGIWFGSEGGVNCNDNPPDSFWYLTIYADDGNGLPDMNNIVIGPELPFTHDGRIIEDLQSGFKPTQYSAPVNVTGLIPGNCYWIEILGEGSGDLLGSEACSWRWMRTDEFDGVGAPRRPSFDGNSWSVNVAAPHPTAFTSSNLKEFDYTWCADSGIVKNTLGNEGQDGGCGDRTGTYACCYRDALDQPICTSTANLFECILSPADGGLTGTAFLGVVCPDNGGVFVCEPPVNDDCVTGATEILQASCVASTSVGRCSKDNSTWCSSFGSVCEGGNGICIPILDTNGQTSVDQFDCTIVPTNNRFATTDGPPAMDNATVIDDCSGSDNGGGPYRADVWWKIVAPCSGLMKVTMCGGGLYDAMLAAYTTCPDGNDISAPDLIECNDDACGSFSTVSNLPAFPVAFDQEVTLRIGGWSPNGVVDPGTDGLAGQGQSQMHVRFACNVIEEQDFNWIAPGGGSFSTDGNWDIAGNPTLFDTAIFNLSTTGYTVTFPSTMSTAGLSIGNDVVTFDLGGNQYNINSFLDILSTDNLFTSQLTVTNGTLRVNNPARLVVGKGAAGSSVNMILDGATAILRTNELHVGGFSSADVTGTLTVQNGADAILTSSQPINIGRINTQTGILNVDGTGSSLSCPTAGIIVGASSNGFLNVTNGSQVDCDFVSVGNSGTAVGDVLVSGINSSITTTNNFDVGNGMGTATLTVSDSGNIDSMGGGHIGGTAIADVTVTGINSTWTIGAGFDVGNTNTGQGLLTIQNGGLFDQTQAGIGFRIGQVGQVQVLAGGTMRTGGSITQGGLTCIGTAIGGVAMVTIDGVGALWEMYGPTEIGVNGPAILTTTNGGAVTDINLSGTTIGPDGQIIGDGTLTGNYVNSGRVHPGASPGVLTIIGDYTQNSIGQLFIEIDGNAPSSFDRLDVSGTATLGGRLIIDKDFFFIPTLGDTFTVLAYGARNGTFTEVDRSPLDNGLAFQLNYNATDLTLEVVADCNFNGIPDVEDLSNCTGDPDCADCEGNGILDVCDIDQCDSFNNPGCGDCNGNGIPDDCDLTGICSGGVNDGLDCSDSTNCGGSPCVGAFSVDANNNGIPDDCLFANGGGNTTDYTDGTNWVDGTAATNNEHAIIDGSAAQLILNANVTVDSMTIREGASLDVSSGDLTTVEPGGIDVNGDTAGIRGSVITTLSIRGNHKVTTENIQVRNNGLVLFDSTSSLDVTDTLHIDAGGRTSKDAAAAAVASTITAGTVVISGGSCASGLNGGELILDDKMSLNVSGDLIMDGSLETADDCTPARRGGITPPPKFDPNGCGNSRRTGIPQVIIGGNMQIRNNVTLSTSSNCARRSAVAISPQILVMGDVINESTMPLTIDWSTGGIALSADDVHMFEVTGRDMGGNASGFELQGCSESLAPCIQGEMLPCANNEACTSYTNGSIGLIEIGNNASVTFVDNFVNDIFIRGEPETLYVDSLIVGTGASVTVDNCHVIYRTLDPPGFMPTLLGTASFETELLFAIPPALLVGAPGFNKDRYISFDPTTNASDPVATRITRVGSTTDKYVDCGSLTDKGADGWYASLIDGPLPAPGDAIYYCDLSGATTGLHVRGCTIVPGNFYNISMTIEGTVFSSTISIPTTPPQAPTREFGDVLGAFDGTLWTAPDGLVTTNDIVGVVKKFVFEPGAPIIARVDNDGAVPNSIVTSSDVLRSVLAFAGSTFGSGVTGCLTGTCVPPVGSCE